MERIALIGFGEAGRTFAAAGLPVSGAFDTNPMKRDGIADHAAPDDVLRGATLILSVVTADQVLVAARDYAPLLEGGVLWCDMNSVAPATKREAASVIEAAGARYCDVAVMAPVDPARLGVPLLVSGRDGEEAVGRLQAAGFDNVRAVGDRIGRASAIKMIRSVMVKGMEALTAEMMLAAQAANVEAEVLASLGDGWDAKAHYNLERMTAHGARRAAEMEESAKTLTALGVEPVMTRGTVVRQREMATPPPRSAAPSRPSPLQGEDKEAA